MRLASTIQKIHDRAPRLGKAVSLATATGAIIGSSLSAGLPVWVMGATKVITGADIADKVVIKVTQAWIRNNNTLIDTILPRNTGAFICQTMCILRVSIYSSATISLGWIPVLCNISAKTAYH